jgi:hypothetical protein
MASELEVVARAHDLVGSHAEVSVLVERLAKPELRSAGVICAPTPTRSSVTSRSFPRPCVPRSPPCLSDRSRARRSTSGRRSSCHLRRSPATTSTAAALGAASVVQSCVHNQVSRQHLPYPRQRHHRAPSSRPPARWPRPRRHPQHSAGTSVRERSHTRSPAAVSGEYTDEHARPAQGAAESLSELGAVAPLQAGSSLQPVAGLNMRNLARTPFLADVDHV